MRRLSIAEQCLYDSTLLFLDEPTSGLDSFNAVLVVSMLKKMAR
jgi:ABC-type multidrug transport system ATPase subunit